MSDEKELQLPSGWTEDEIREEDLPPEGHHHQTEEDPPDLPTEEDQ